MNNLLVIFLVLLLIGVFPIWPHSAHWGYYPGGGVGALLLLVVIFVIFSPRALR
ncbi:MAG: DUF3309 family protein [Bdellovibrionota bacterium]